MVVEQLPKMLIGFIVVLWIGLQITEGPSQ